MNRAAPSPENRFLAEHATLLCESYRRLTGRDLLTGARATAERAEALFRAPFVVLSHGTDDDPIFNYGNRTALELFEMTWGELTAMPSRRSAEPLEREARERLLREVARNGFIDDYAGVRISKTGRRFMIERATVWNLNAPDGTYVGQGATFSRWYFL